MTLVYTFGVAFGVDVTGEDRNYKFTMEVIIMSHSVA